MPQDSPSPVKKRVDVKAGGDDEGSGSDTGSESMFTQDNRDRGDNGKQQTYLYEEDEEEEEVSSDILQPTQVTKLIIIMRE